jgi:lipoprotein-anchoring transpeptidase ErfK/SrfK
MTAFTRRDFLRLASATVLGGALSSRLSIASAASNRLGRVATDYLRIHQKASDQSKVLGWKGFDEVVPILQDVVGDDKKAWIETGDGYILGADVQPVTQTWNKAVAAISKPGQIGEITVPFTDARRKPDLLAPVAYRLYFSSTYWVRELVYDGSKKPWYKLYDERLGIYYYADARAVRLVPASELKPLSPSVDNKRVLVSLKDQRVTAYEGKAEVFSTLVSTGRLYLADDGSAHSWTPNGEFVIDRKRPSRHMGFGEAAGSDYELPGVPWVSYFHWKGFSFHGTWWHNDYGRPRSAGCVNMRSDEAKWLYRWSFPTAPIDQEVYMSSGGTALEIVED